MPTILLIYHDRDSAGFVRTFIADPRLAQLVFRLTGSLVLSDRHAQALAALGFTFETVADPKGVKSESGKPAYCVTPTV